MELVEALLADADVAADPRARELAPLLALPTGKTSSGWPYLQEPAWVRFRDWVPHILAEGPRTLLSADKVLAAGTDLDAGLGDAGQVVRQVVFSAAVTAPPDLWLVRHVVGALASLGLSERLLQGEAIHPSAARAGSAKLRAEELLVDLRLLLSRGLLQLTANGAFRLAEHAAARDVFEKLGALAGPVTADDSPLPPAVRAPGWFAPNARDVVVGARLVPLVLALKEAGAIPRLLESGRVLVDDLTSLGGALSGARGHETLVAAGVIDEERALTMMGRRVLERGPGPFGIIAAYQGYVEKLADVWQQGRGTVWVERKANVSASQAANRATFEKANAALDKFCADTGFSYQVFIEHALGKGEATRQRARQARTGSIAFVGADLEDAAIEAARAERDAGVLPKDMLLVPRADIGKPETLLEAMKQHGISADGAVMLVGNGFHEVRDQTDPKMIAVLRGYAQAGIVLLFTEETGLSVEDLLHTAWNTYHAGFKYVHERSGQGLRPAEHAPPSALESRRPLSWAECVERAGYVRLEAYSPRGRTVYPYTPPSGHNPAISVTHFCVPRALADRLQIG